jgi:L-aspartate oxidase
MAPLTGPELIVVGAGAAGLYTAICAARAGARVILISATPLAESSSYWAQGGLAAAISAQDSPELHLADTLRAGRNAVRESAARVLTSEAGAAVEDLARLGVNFDADRSGRLALGLEGGHSIRRIVHAGGASTGRRIVRQLSAVVAKQPLIDVVEDRRVTALVVDEGRCTGVVLGDGETVAAPATALATGGSAALWARTTNPPGATGGGLLLAYDAGAGLADLEMMQFHPTALVAGDGAGGLLVTEAIRGEGARLLDAAGERFVDELAPRDEVARAIFRQLTLTGSDSVDLDMRDVDPALFPTVVTALQQAGLDPERELIPVAPAAHYMMGGIATDLDAGSSLPGLLAIGECSCTGLHGANRLASNSLSECFVFGARAARRALREPPLGRVANAVATGPPRSTALPTLTQASREALWRHAGIERSSRGLRLLLDDPHPLVRLVAEAALRREESRGAHIRSDFPDRDPALDHRHVVLTSGAEPRFELWI